MDGMYAGNEAGHPHITDAVLKFRNHINFVEHENRDIRRQIANQVPRVTNGDTRGIRQNQQFRNSQCNMDPLEDVRSTCAMLSERLRLMEEQNNALLMNAEKQRCDYERCLDRVSGQVFETLTCQRRLQMECDALRIQVRDLIRALSRPNSLGSRSSETSPIDNSHSWQSSYGAIPDDACVAYGYENLAHTSPNGFRNGYQPDSRFSFSPTLPATHEFVSGGPDHRSPVIVQMLPAVTEHMFHGPPQRYPNSYNYQLANGCGIPSMGPQQDRRPPPHRTQGVLMSPTLQTIPDALEPTAASQCTTVAHARLPSNVIARPPVPFNATGAQRLARDDGVVGRVSRSRDRQVPSERNKIARSRSFDEHFGHSRANNTNSSKPLFPRWRGTIEPQPPAQLTFEPPKEGQQHSSLSSDSTVSQSLGSDMHSQSQSSKRDATEIHENAKESCRGSIELVRTKMLNDTSHASQVNGEVCSHEPTEPEKRPLKTSPTNVQTSFRATSSSESDEQTKLSDDVCLPHTNSSKGPEASRPRTNRFESGNRKHTHEEDLPPPPPPPPPDDLPKYTFCERDEKYTPAQEDALQVAKKTVLSKRESYAAACHKPSLFENAVTSNEMPNPGRISKELQRDEKLDAAFETHSDSKTQGNDTTADDAITITETRTKQKNEIPHSKTRTDKLPKKGKKREPFKPLTSKSTNLNTTACEDLNISCKISPSISYEVMPSSAVTDSTSKVPRRLSEGMVRDVRKRNRIASTSAKSSMPGPDVSPPNHPVNLADSSPEGPNRKGTTSTSYNDLSVANDSGSNEKQLLAHSHSHLPLFGARNTAEGHEQTISLHHQDLSIEQRAAVDGSPLHSRSKLYQPVSGVDKSSLLKKANEISKVESSNAEKKSDNKKKHGNQKSFVGMMKSKFGVRSSSNKKAVEARERQQPSEVTDNGTTLSLVGPQELTSAPKNENKKQKEDFDDKKLNEPVPNSICDLAGSQDQPCNKAFGMKRFMSRNQSKRLKNNSRRVAFDNGEHYNNYPYGRVELIPVATSFERKPKDCSVDNCEKLEEIPSTLNVNENSRPVHKGENFAENSSKKHNYENFFCEGRSALNFADGEASHSYENVVITRTSNVTNDVNAFRKQQPTTSENIVEGRETELKQPDLSKRSRNNPSNHSLNKLSVSDSGSGMALHEVAGGRYFPGQVNSAKKAGMYANEQQMFEKAFISSVVEAELNSAGPKNDSGYLETVQSKFENDGGVSSIPGLSPDLPGKSDVSFSTSNSPQSANSGFDSWPSKSVGPDLASENASGGSLDTRFKDMNCITGRQNGLQTKSSADSHHSSLGSFGYGSGVSGSSTASSNKSRSRSPMRTNVGKFDAKSGREARDSSSDSKLTPLPKPISIQSRYAAKKFASPGDNSPVRRLQKPQNIGKPRADQVTGRVKMGVNSILPQRTRGRDSNVSEKIEGVPTSCMNRRRQESTPSQIPKDADLLKNGPRNVTNRGRFGAQRTIIPLRYSGSRQHHTG